MVTQTPLGAHPVNAYYRYKSLEEFKRSRRLEGPFRVLVFCLLAIFLPCLLLGLPLYIRYEAYKDVPYHLGESDLVTVDKPISTFWCSGQELRMNATFHAYLLNEKPKISEDLKEIEMKKHMQLADDSLEYWGFFLLQGSKVTLSVCSRFDGARLMVVKGAKNLKHCALIDPARNDDQIDPWEEDVSAPHGEKIEVTFQQGEAPAGIVDPPKKKQGNAVIHNNSSEMLSAAVEAGRSLSELKKNETVRRNGRRERRPERLSTTTQRNLQTGKIDDALYDNGKVLLRHISQLDTKVLRTKRFIVSEDDFKDENENYNHEQKKAEEEADDPPNPVGVEPRRSRTENHVERNLGGGQELGEHDEAEAIDEEDIRSSGSSFAKNLWSCYGGDTLFTQTFSPSSRCVSQDAMMKYARMKMVHEVTSTGYYYYIFYSDNDIVSNDIFARFNIDKVEYSFPNYTNSCLNTTHCSLPLSFFSSEKVLLEVPLQDGVSDEDALAQMVLISTCNPRLGVYFIFPTAIIFCILACAFL